MSASKWFTIHPRKIENWKSRKLAANSHDKTEYVIHIINLNQALNHGLALKKSESD